MVYSFYTIGKLKGREGAAKILSSIEEEIDKLVEILKEL